MTNQLLVDKGMSLIKPLPGLSRLLYKLQTFAAFSSTENKDNRGIPGLAPPSMTRRLLSNPDRSVRMN
ncbi:hypothetical protein V6N12_004704 [Hibiscus sabdariffa]|uniref:Uncharacterized protein n=1 Tax=Hibiscus sabdariffa TaxID=183260 RepID=A0ABR2CP02_9ROSI